MAYSIGRMKKTKPAKRPGAKKGKRPQTVDEYLAGVPEPACSTLKKMRAAIRSAVPPGTSEVISYGIPGFRGKGMLVWYAAFENHCSFFPTPAVIETFRSELKGFTTSKGTIQFPADKPLPAALVKKMVKARLARIENTSQNKSKVT